MEGLGLVKAHSVGGAHLVCVLVFLGSPAGAVPVLAIHGVARAKCFPARLLEMSVLSTRPSRIRMLRHIHLIVWHTTLIKHHSRISIPMHWLRVRLRVVERRPSCG